MASTTARRRRPRRERRAGADSSPPLERGAWTRLAACTGAAALLQIDGTLITVALPSAARGLHVSPASTSTVLTVYFVAYALTLLPAGALVDRIGGRRVALAGLALFGAAAAGGAVSSDIGVLLVTRVLQGVGAGLVSPAALAGAVSGFPPERRGAALGIWGASAGAANLVGPLLGGLLTIAFGWRADWWALVPLAALAMVAIVTQMPAHTATERPPRWPILSETLIGAAGVATLTFGVMIGCFYLAEQYLQRQAGFSALGASAVLVLVALLVGAAAPLAGRLVDTYGERVPALLGFVFAAIGLGVLGIPGVSLSGVVTILPLIPVGIGLGLLFVPASRAALNATPRELHGRTSAVLSVGRLVGAGAGAGLAGLALTGDVQAATVHTALLIGCAACVFAGLPLAMMLSVPVAHDSGH